MENFKDRIIHLNATLIEALKLMDRLDKKSLLILDSTIFKGILSAGDVQRAIIQNKPLTTEIQNIIRPNIKVASVGDSYESIKQMMIDFRMEMCPVISESNEIVQVYYWEDIFENKKLTLTQQLNLPVVIMAGGFGTRLKPLTNVLPKPLIPIGEKTMLEEIIDRFSVYGCQDYFVSVNYKADLIQFYIDNLKLPQTISFFMEDKPLGTAGSLSLLKDKIKSTFFVTNCDILIDQDYAEILNFHNDQKNELTLVAAVKHYQIPYGTLETGEGGALLALKEKPDLSILVNTGMYVLEPHILDEIPEGTFFHITHLIEKIKAQGKKVGVFPVSEGSWLDTGEWAEYNKTQEKISKRSQS
jgi:dTDP-glucose pyrophosphorylase